MDQYGHHAIMCKLGGLITKIHDACCLRIWQAATETGAAALREQVIPALQSAARKEPRIDVEVWGLPSLPYSLHDFTLCAPMAARYQHDDTSAVPSAAEARKRREYPRAAGLAVEGMAMNIYGTMGPALRETLEKWADRARLQDVSRGRTPRRWLNLWSAQLSTEVAIGAARLVLTSDRSPCIVQRFQKASPQVMPSSAGGGVCPPCITGTDSQPSRPASSDISSHKVSGV